MTDKALVFGSFRLMPAQRLLLENGTPLRLGSRALDILIVLAERAGETIAKEELIARVWPDTVVDESALRVHVAALRRTLGDDRAGVRTIANVPGRGYALVVPVTREMGSPAMVQPAPSLAQGNMPRPLNRVVGRHDTVSVLTAQLPRRRLLTIVGPGGIGKTTIAIAVADAVSANFGDGVWLVGLASLPDPDLVPLALGSVLGVMLTGPDPVSGLIGWLRDKEALIILDSCEHVIGATAALAEAVLHSASRVRILATSREPLRAEGEWLHRLASLQTPPDIGDITADDALRYSAVQLFEERARATAKDFTLTDQDVRAVLEICRRLDGVPLALELAAARVDAFGVKDLAIRLDHRFAVLTRGHRTALPRQQTLRATMDWSYNLLSDTEQVVFRRLAVFQGDFTMEAAGATASDSRISVADVIEIVANLIEKSLVVTELAQDVGYHRLLDTTRAYAAEKLEETGEIDQVRRLHATYQCRLFGRVEEDPARSTRQWPAGFNRHLGDLRAALNWAFSPGGDTALGGDLTAAATDFWLASSLLSECLDWSVKALGQLGDAAGGRREMFLQCGLWQALSYGKGLTPGARAAVTRALAIAQALGDREYQKRALFGLWIWSVRAAECQASLSFARRYEALGERAGDPATQPIADWITGVSAFFLGQHGDANERLQRSLDRHLPADRCLDIIRFGADPCAHAFCYYAASLWMRGFPERAMVAGRRAIAAARDIQHPVSLCLALAWPSSMLLIKLGDLDAAQDCITELIDHTEKHALAPYHALGLCAKGSLAAVRGDNASGARQIRSGLSTMAESGYYVFYPVFQAELAAMLASDGHVDEALGEIDATVQRCLDAENLWFVPEALRIKGDILKLGGAANPQELENLFMRSLEQARRQHAPWWELRSAISLGELWSAQHRKTDARAVLSSAYSRFTEGFATPDLQQARRLLEQLA